MIALDAPTSCLDALEISLLFCYTLTCNCLLKVMCPLKSALKMGAHQISYFAAWDKLTRKKLKQRNYLYAIPHRESVIVSPPIKRCKHVQVHIQILPDQLRRSHMTQYCWGYCSWSTIEGTLQLLYAWYSCHSSSRLRLQHTLNVPSTVLQLAVAPRGVTLCIIGYTPEYTKSVEKGIVFWTYDVVDVFCKKGYIFRC